MKTSNKFIMRNQIAGMVCILAFFVCLMGTRASAAGSVPPASEAAVVSSRTTEDAVYLYIKGVEDITSGTTVQVGNAMCEEIQVADITSMGMPIRTLILFDNSQSLSANWGKQAKELIAGLIDNHAEGEEFKVATFADGLNVVSDFSTDYDSLKAAVEGIEFLNQPSYLTDILYELLNQSSNSEEANYLRFIIITDGADDNEIKYTQTELSDLMKKSGVVIHVVGVKAANNNNLLENLFSYARLTGGTYSIADGNSDVENVRNTINEDYSLLCLKLIPTAEIMDGSRKEAKLKLNTSQGEVVLQASLQMPFADLSNIPAASEPAETIAPSESVKAESPTLPSIEVQQPEKEKQESKLNIVPFIAIGLAVFFILAVVVILLILKGKKKKPVDVVIANQSLPAEEPHSESSQSGDVSQGGNTVMLGTQTAGAAGKTMRLQGGNGQAAIRQSFIILTDITNPQRSFRAAIQTRIVIGRESADIILSHDTAVSRAHCEIIKKGNLFYVNDLRSSNGTFYENMRVYNETPIMSGGILEVGTYKYKVTIEN